MDTSAAASQAELELRLRKAMNNRRARKNKRRVKRAVAPATPVPLPLPALSPEETAALLAQRTKEAALRKTRERARARRAAKRKAKAIEESMSLSKFTDFSKSHAGTKGDMREIRLIIFVYVGVTDRYSAARFLCKQPNVLGYDMYSKMLKGHDHLIETAPSTNPIALRVALLANSAAKHSVIERVLTDLQIKHEGGTLLANLLHGKWNAIVRPTPESHAFFTQREIDSYHGKRQRNRMSQLAIALMTELRVGKTTAEFQAELEQITKFSRADLLKLSSSATRAHRAVAMRKFLTENCEFSDFDRIIAWDGAHDYRAVGNVVITREILDKIIALGRVSLVIRLQSRGTTSDRSLLASSADALRCIAVDIGRRKVPLTGNVMYCMSRSRIVNARDVIPGIFGCSYVVFLRRTGLLRVGYCTLDHLREHDHAFVYDIFSRGNFDRLFIELLRHVKYPMDNFDGAGHSAVQCLARCAVRWRQVPLASCYSIVRLSYIIDTLIMPGENLHRILTIDKPRRSVANVLRNLLGRPTSRDVAMVDWKWF